MRRTLLGSGCQGRILAGISCLVRRSTDSEWLALPDRGQLGNRWPVPARQRNGCLAGSNPTNNDQLDPALQRNGGPADTNPTNIG
ncbi:hypothetical protein [Amycolatopsis circi]|uniref:hypothetical protein n=1 Tax=Amycolatopsis circi TaxID=871959 RepID=UPI0013BE9572|nr:hypothetical protein [Amycolatopsis circi]